MPFVPTEHGAKVFMQFSNPLGTWGNILWFKKEDYVLADLQWLATQVKKSFVDNWVDKLVLGTSLPTVIGYDMRTVDGEMATAAGPNGTGDVDNEPLPLGECLVVTFRTPKRGRAYRGRIYLAGMAEPQLDSALWEQDLRDAAIATFDDLKNELFYMDWEWGVHTTQVDHEKISPQTVTEITSYEVRSAIPGSQRRRNRRP